MTGSLKKKVCFGNIHRLLKQNYTHLESTDAPSQNTLICPGSPAIVIGQAKIKSLPVHVIWDGQSGKHVSHEKSCQSAHFHLLV